MTIQLKFAKWQPDFSGASAVVVVDGYSFAFDRVGHTICNLLNVGCSRAPSKRTIARAHACYEEWLSTLPEGWLTENEAYYLVDIETV